MKTALFLTGMALMIVFSPVAAESATRTETLTIEGRLGGKSTFQVEIADTTIALEVGLMFREKLEPDHGMLFELGKTDVTRFWMKDTLIPLDMLFIAPDGEIKKIHANAEPKSLKGISSDAPVKAVLEIPGGRAKELGIMAGDKVTHPYFK